MNSGKAENTEKVKTVSTEVGGKVVGGEKTGQLSTKQIALIKSTCVKKKKKLNNKHRRKKI